VLLFYSFAIFETGFCLTFDGFVNILWLNCPETLRQQGQFQSTVELHLSGLNGTTSHVRICINSGLLDFSLKIGYIVSFEVANISTNASFRLHIYLRTNKTLIHNFFYVLGNWGKK
jgi:hypothetical protein